jgi:hypothetical protein
MKYIFTIVLIIIFIFFYENNLITINILINFRTHLKIIIMKKVLLIAGVVLLGLGNVNAQDGAFNLGVNFALPTGDAGDVYSFAIGVEANYLFQVSEEFQVGPSVSYISYFGKSEVFGIDVDIDNAGFLPLAAAGRFNASDKFVLGADLGYAIGINPEGNDGGFYYRPMVGYDVNEKIQITVSYSGVSLSGDGDGTFSNIGIGAMFAL